MQLKQSIPVNSIKNARELGGYITSDGKTVKNGVLLRSASLNGASGEDIRLLRDKYRLQHIIDFRMEMELKNSADPMIDGAQYHHLNVIDMAQMIPDGAPEVDISALDPAQIAEITIESGMLNENMYIGFLNCDTGKKAFSEFLRILLYSDPDRAVLWHCTSGKDRTGLAAMLLLSALGADEELIVRDFLLTNVYYADRIEGTKQFLKTKGCDDAFTEQALLVFDAVDERFMRNAIGFLKKEYGSVVGYIRGGLKLSQDEIDSLKEKYLI